MESRRKAERPGDQRGSTTLIALMGMSPGVITESLYALGRQGERFDALEVLTTQRAVARFLEDWGDGSAKDSAPGAARTFRRLLGWLATDHPDLGLDPRMQLRVHLPEIDGRPIADITTDAEARAFLDCCWRVVQRSRGSRLVAGIAGGRKTMGAALLQCMTLLGRAGDRAVHVLVDPSYERPWFLYPGQEAARAWQAELQAAEGAQVVLHDLDLAPIGALVAGIDRDTDFADVARQARAVVGSLAEPRVEIDTESRTVRLDGRELSLPVRQRPTVLAFMLMAFEAKLGCPEPSRGRCGPCRRCWVGWRELGDDWCNAAGGWAREDLEGTGRFGRAATRLTGSDRTWLRSPVGVYSRQWWRQSDAERGAVEKPVESLRRVGRNASKYLREGLDRLGEAGGAWADQVDRLVELLDPCHGRSTPAGVGVMLDRSRILVDGRGFKG